MYTKRALEMYYIVRKSNPIPQDTLIQLNLSGGWYLVTQVATVYNDKIFYDETQNIKTEENIYLFENIQTIISSTGEVKYLDSNNNILNKKEVVAIYKKNELKEFCENYTEDIIPREEYLDLNSSFQYATAALGFNFGVSELKAKTDIYVQYMQGKSFEEIEEFLLSSNGWIDPNIYDRRMKRFLQTVYTGVIVQHWKDKICDILDEANELIDRMVTSTGCTEEDILDVSVELPELDISILDII